MIDLNIILEKILLAETASMENVNDAIDNKYRVIINYHSKGENEATGARIIEPHAYGLTKAGNPVIRAFQPYGDTTSKVPSWKFFRLDRISMWKPTKQIFSEPASERYRGLGDFNENGDETMSTVYNIANFDNDSTPETVDIKTPTPPTPKTKIYKTDTEKNMNRLKQQVDNPIYMSDIKTQNSFGDIEKKNIEQPNKGGAKEITKNNVAQTLTNEPENVNIYKTDTEKNIERIKQQMNNPQYVDQSIIDRYNREKNKKYKKYNTYGK